MEKLLLENFTISKTKPLDTPRGKAKVYQLASGEGVFTMTQDTDLTKVGGGTVSFISSAVAKDTGIF